MIVEDIAEGNSKEHDTKDLVQRLQMLCNPQDEIAATDVAIATTLLHSEIDSIELNDYEWTVVQNARKRDFFIYQIVVNLSKDCLIKSARAFLVIKNLEEKGEIIKSLPNIEE